ncbi:hypothetical protein BS47DRAFT_1340515 [Hydnum rufescens UP504]|uniref:Uncharacterized protein n=1 Tax=Hydnum rufescens UP504 TaxID=1448309 RepID=A0A9P6B309_9AGAM|nr:hypothetical protein BS47DRAFT_1340515 [Hydnum rufescens UP504]
MLGWTGGQNQNYYPFYNPAQQAYSHPQPSEGSHPHAGSSNPQLHIHSSLAGGASEGVRSVPAADRPRGRKRKRTPEPPTDASLLVRPTAPARRSPTPPKQSVTSSRGGNRFTQADVTYLHKYINYCRDMGHMLSLREICEKLAIKARASHHSFFSWRRYCNRHKIRIGPFSMEDATPGEGNPDHDDGDGKEASDKDREVEGEVSNKDNDDQTQPPEPLNAVESSDPIDPPPHEGTESPALQTPLRADPNIDPMLMTTGIKPRATDAASNVVSPDDKANPIARPIPVTSGTGETSTAPEGPQSARGGATYANATPKVLARSTSGKGIAFTAEDVEFLVRFMAYRRRQENGDLSMSQFWTDITQRAPHHSRASWMKYWRRHHHELDGTPDDKPVTVPPAKRTRYSYDDDVCLARFFSTHPEGIQDAVFRQFAAENPHHPWKGWQEHYRLHRAQILHLIGRLERGENIDERVDEIIDEVPP